MCEALYCYKFTSVDRWNTDDIAETMTVVKLIAKKIELLADFWASGDVMFQSYALAS